MTNENKTLETTEITETVDEQGGKSFPTPEAVATPADEVSNADPIEQPEPETFPREYVARLRKEAADNRAKAKRADDYARELFTARVGALGKLHDPADMAFDAELLDDPDKLTQAVEELVSRKPYLARQVVTGNVGQGATPTTPNVTLIDTLRG